MSDPDDVDETSTWSCPQCGAGDTCVKGDEAMCLAAHTALNHPPGN